MSKRMLILCLSAVVAASGPAWAQEASSRPGNLVEVTVTGVGMDKDEATRDAMRKAVEKGAGAYIHSQSQTKDFALVQDSVLVRAAGFIQSHKVLAEKKLEDGTWEVKVSAMVSIKGVEDFWGTVTTLLKQMGRPKIMVFVREKIGAEAVEDSTVQARIENLLLESGFLLVDKEQIKAIDQKDLSSAAAEDNPAKLQAIAKKFGAQLFITGSAVAAPGERKNVGGIELFPYQADANIKCFRSDTAQLLSSIPGEPTRSADRVARSAAKKALDLQAQQVAPRVRMDILKFWQEALAGRGEVQLHVEGVSFKQYMALKKALETLKNVKDVKAEYHNQIAECSLQSDVRAEVLAEKIVENLQGLEVQDVSQNVIKAKFKPE